MIEYNLNDKIKLLKGLMTGARAYTGPFFVNVDITRRCNLQCVGCHYHSPLATKTKRLDTRPEHISVELINRLCNELSVLGTKGITLTGEGEPFLHPRLFDLISALKKAKLKVRILTNGTLLSASVLNTLIDLRLDFLTVSLWASSPEEWKHSYSEKSYTHFDRIIEKLQLLSAIKTERKVKYPSVGLHHPVHKGNFKKIHGMTNLASKCGCNTLTFSPFLTKSGQMTQHGLSRSEEKTLSRLMAQMKGKLKALSIQHNIDESLLRYRIGEAVWEKLPCYVGWIHSRIKMDGTVQPCGPCTLKMGDLTKNPFQDIWNGRAYKAFRRLTRTRRGIARLAENYACDFCCFAEKNMTIHQVFRWLAPFRTVISPLAPDHTSRRVEEG